MRKAGGLPPSSPPCFSGKGRKINLLKYLFLGVNLHPQHPKTASECGFRVFMFGYHNTQYLVFIPIITHIFKFVYSFLRKIFQIDYKFVSRVTIFLEDLYI